MSKGKLGFKIKNRFSSLVMVHLAHAQMISE
ncbi:hypothetical protein Vch1786_I0854 [Vibrio cholerae O1 str. 2010EL-1786]|uniref:Uncharacterized protein n=2 Tax=Vibrio cholerae TaxID=666 RepID=Q9KSA7_VIBCH|nr:hypothetical protein VC_1352 [Vibrio cholerae O1 biovar El Tor str. N16961]ACP05623.1 conserved hypothetical protein [Vibrio cholerae M66-2]ACP09479.1 conserved hypothetical protein [Vibrio cholerae O395]ACQ61148.1 hypothetical protein VCD_002988 [Vibrio cholerae MJ-1236]AET26458.1 hypothetical protein Vch1786_I0854 [Vibrio cholerae O1 str. 2010EL-1786]EEO06560.1 hypothetical protein VIF_001996 [Vibrio cholerae TM 11079-80]EEO10071.1 hypothetical protein VCC_002406 [Vibrio cholerae RC9]EE